MFLYLLKTINLRNGKIFWSYHETTELLFPDSINYRPAWFPYYHEGFHADWKLYGIEAFTQQVVECYTSKEVLEKALQHCIATTPEALRYNSTKGFTEESREKIVESALKYTWITNGKKSKKVLKEGLKIPDGWWVGMHHLNGKAKPKPPKETVNESGSNGGGDAE